MAQVLDDRRLERLLCRAGLCGWARWTWFRGCRLEGAAVVVDDRELAKTLRRCYLAQLQLVLPGCQILDTGKDDRPRRAYAGEVVVPERLGGL